MIARMTTATALVAAWFLLILAMWTWSSASNPPPYSANPDAVAWAAKCFALSAASAAELIILVFIVGSMFPKRIIDDIVRASAAFVCSIAFVSAIALKLAGS